MAIKRYAVGCVWQRILLYLSEQNLSPGRKGGAFSFQKNLKPKPMIAVHDRMSRPKIITPADRSFRAWLRIVAPNSWRSLTSSLPRG